MALTDEELGVLNSLMYEGGLDLRKKEATGKSLGELLTEWKSKEDYNPDYESVVEAALNDPSVSNLVLRDVDSYSDRGNSSVCFQDTTDGAEGALYVVYKGTGTGEDGSEWYTNFMGLTETDTDPQVAARNYAEYCKLAYGGTLTVTGHSNGGNKAMYAGITYDGVDRVVAFDGQGFGTAFYERYSSQVSRNASKIKMYCTEGDYVNPLLMFPESAEKLYVNRVGAYEDSEIMSWAYNHSMNALFPEESFKLSGYSFDATGSPSTFSMLVSDFSSYIYETLTPSEIEALAPFLGGLVQRISGGDWDGVVALLMDESSKEPLATLIALLTTYEGSSALVCAFLDAVCQSSDNPLASYLRTALAVSAASGSLLISSIATVLTFLGLSALYVSGILDLAKEKIVSIQRYKTSGVDRGSIKASVRDFSDDKLNDLISTVEAVENEAWYDGTRWDIWYRAERWFGNLSIENYQNNMSEYYRKTIDVDGITKKKVRQIFEDARAECGSFASVLESHYSKPVSSLTKSFKGVWNT